MAWEATKGEHAKTAVCTRQTGTPVYYKFTTTGETGYVFVGWYDQQGSLVSTIQDLSYKESSYPSGLTLTARWGKSYTHSVERTNPDYSTIVGFLSGTVYFIDGVCVRGDDLSVTVAAKAGKIFTGWSGDTQYATINGGTCEISKDVERKVKVYAGFAEAATVTLAYDIGDGTSTPPPSESQTVAKDANAVFTLAAAPTAPLGHRFTGWTLSTDSSSYNPREAGSSVSIKASSTRTVTATASYKEYDGHAITTQAKCDGVDVQKFITLLPPENAHNANMEVSGWLPQTPMTADAAEVLYDEQNHAEYQFASWTATGGVTLSTPTEHFTRFTMQSADVTLTANYVLKNLDVRAEVHSASEGKVTASRTLTRGGETVQDNARYGDVATFSASGIPPGYSFAGWYTEGGTRRSSNTTYTTTLVDDLVLYAKVSVQVSFRWTSATPYVSHGPLTLNGQKFLNGEASADLPVGSTVEIKAELDEGEFTGFTKDDEPISFTSPSEGVYVAQTTVPNVAAEIVAGWAEEVESYYVALYAQDGSGNYTSDGAFELTGKNVEEITRSAYESSMSAKHSTTVTARSELGKFYKVVGAQIVRIRAYAMGALPFKRFDWDEWRQGGGLQSITPPLSSSPDYDNDFSVAGDYVGIGVFKEGATVKVRIRHEDESRVVTGSLQLDGAKSYEYAQNGYYAEGEFDEDASVTIMARPASGYKFGGWFEVASADDDVPPGAEPVSTSALWTFPAPATNKFYVARFEEDSVGILLWEGSGENMEMEWTSKVYVAPKPFDPVAARVDATGYPVQLDVGTMSSPNAKPTRPHPIEVASQDGRRLPRMRPERFVRFTVKASCEIDAVVIGTNMAEVN